MNGEFCSVMVCYKDSNYYDNNSHSHNYCHSYHSSNDTACRCFSWYIVMGIGLCLYVCMYEQSTNHISLTKKAKMLCKFSIYVCMYVCMYVCIDEWMNEHFVTLCVPKRCTTLACKSTVMQSIFYLSTLLWNRNLVTSMWRLCDLIVSWAVYRRILFMQ